MLTAQAAVPIVQGFAVTPLILGYCEIARLPVLEISSNLVVFSYQSQCLNRSFRLENRSDFFPLQLFFSLLITIDGECIHSIC